MIDEGEHDFSPAFEEKMTRLLHRERLKLMALRVMRDLAASCAMIFILCAVILPSAADPSPSVDIDIQLNSTVTSTPFLGNGDKRFTSSLRISPFITYANYSKHTPVMKGCTVGFTVSYLGLLRSLNM